MTLSRRTTLFTVLLALLPLLGFWATGLLDLDEGFYGAVTAEMNRRGEWITPYYNGQPWFEKPILLYWLAKPCLMLLGPDWGPRLPSILCAAALYWMVYRFVRSRFGEPEAIVSTLILGTSLLVVALGRMMMTDVPLVLALTGCFMAFWNSLDCPESDRTRWRALAGIALGFSVLAKGPVGGIFFVLLAFATFRSQPELRVRFSGGWWAGVLGFVAVVGAWYLPAYLASGDLFVQEFLIKQNIGRFSGGDLAHKVPFPENLIFFPAIVLLGFAPWWWHLRRAWPSKFSAWSAGLAPMELSTLRYLGWWAAIIFVFFSVSGSKLIHYILPCWPPLAIIVGVYLARGGVPVRGQIPVITKQLKFTFAGLLVGLCILANVGFWFHYRNVGQNEAHRYARLAKAAKQPLAVYQLSRRQKDLGTGSGSLQETSLPSIGLVYDGVFATPETAEDLRDFRGYVLTRVGRLTDAEMAANGLKLLETGKKFLLLQKN